MSALRKSLALVVALTLVLTTVAVGLAWGPTNGAPGPLGSGEGGDGGDADRSTARPPFSVTVTAERVGSTTTEYTMAFDFDDDAGTVRFSPRGAALVVDSDGFETGVATAERRDGAETGRLVYRVDAADLATAAGTDEWLATTALDGQFEWTTADGDERGSAWLQEGPAVDANWTATVEGTGEMSLGGFVHFGSHERLTREVDGRTVTMIVSPEVSDQFDPSARLSALAAMDRQFGGGGRAGPLVVFAVSDDRGQDRVVRNFRARGVGKFSTMYVTESVDNDTLFHEYVHTRQTFLTNTSGETGWLVEASAQYYMKLYDWKVGDRSLEKEVVPGLNVPQQSADAVLSQPYTWDQRYRGIERAPYTKGSRVIAYLDQRIREETGGDRTFEDVLRRINERGGVQSNEAFAGVVADVAGDESLANETLRYATTEANPAKEHDLSVIPPDQRAAVQEQSGGESGGSPGFGLGAGVAALLGLLAAATRERGR